MRQIVTIFSFGKHFYKKRISETKYQLLSKKMNIILQQLQLQLHYKHTTEALFNKDQGFHFLNPNREKTAYWKNLNPYQ